MDETLLTVYDCARLAANSVAFWRKVIHHRLIPVVRVGRSVRIRRRDFEAFLRSGAQPARRPHHLVEPPVFATEGGAG